MRGITNGHIFLPAQAPFWGIGMRLSHESCAYVNRGRGYRTLNQIQQYNIYEYLEGTEEDLGIPPRFYSMY